MISKCEKNVGLSAFVHSTHLGLNFASLGKAVYPQSFNDVS